MSLLSSFKKRSTLDAAIKQVAQARKSEGGKAEQLYRGAYQGFASVIADNLLFSEALYNWGFALLHEARSKDADCDEFWLVAGGKVEPFDGDLDDYQRWLMEQSREAARAAKEAQSKPAPVKAIAVATMPAPATPELDRKAAALARQKLSDLAKPFKKEQAQVEQKLAAAQAEHAQLLEAMASADVPPATRADQGRRLKQLDDQIEELEMRWLELGEKLEAITQQG